jgi:S1-C subfamily serine protease
LPVPRGESSDLNWGAFVYVMGFPKGEKMVESGIVSKPEKNNDSYFITNAIFNRGISGGPVFALRDGASGMEWVGMAKSAPATDIFYLQPAVNKEDMYSKSKPYKGKVLINKKKMINYGITYSVSMQEIVRFVKSIGSELEQEGFDIQQFFYHPPE